MTPRSTRALVILTALLALAPALHAANPLTLEKHQSRATRIAPPFPTAPGKVLCVCQTENNSGKTFLGYLNSYTVNDAGDQTVNLVCTYPVFTPGLGFAFCSLFEVVR